MWEPILLGVYGAISASVVVYSRQLRASKRAKRRRQERQEAIDRVHARGCICLWEGERAFIDVNCPYYDAHLRVYQASGANVVTGKQSNSVN